MFKYDNNPPPFPLLKPPNPGENKPLVVGDCNHAKTLEVSKKVACGLCVLLLGWLSRFPDGVEVMEECGIGFDVFWDVVVVVAVASTPPPLS